MKPLLMSLLLILVFLSIAKAQTPDKALQQAVADGTAVPIQVTVQNNVTAQAVLIPRKDARRIFGKKIAENYAVVELNVGNKSSESALIIHGVFVDYGGWGLSGSINVQPSVSTPDRFRTYQSAASPNQVASEEYRVVRDQLQNGSMFSGRNWTMRALQLAASIAAAYPFGLTKLEERYFGVFSGTLVPGINTLWPDDTQQQMLRISDYGFRTNKVIPKESADIVVCFFPIDRFLTPAFRDLYLKSPALFFSPLQMLVDKKLEKDVDALLATLKPDAPDPLNKRPYKRADLAAALPCYIRIAREKDYVRDADTPIRNRLNELEIGSCLLQFGLKQANDGKIDLLTEGNKEHEKRKDAPDYEKADEDVFLWKFGKLLALDFLSHMSLNSMSITVDGTMTLDTSSLAPKIESLKFDSIDCGGDQAPCFWSETEAKGVRTGTIVGSYLTNGTIHISEASDPDVGLKDVKIVHEGSNDQMLNFSFTLTKPIPTGTKLHFKVTKPLTGVAALNGKSLDSKELEYLVKGPVMSIASDFDENGILTLTSDDFANAPPKLNFKLHPSSGADVELKVKTTTDKSFEFEPVTISAGCWEVQAFTEKQPIGMTKKSHFLVNPNPEDDTATLDASDTNAKKIIIDGEDLEAKDCDGNPITYLLVKDEKTSFKLEKPISANKTKVTFAVPAAASEVAAGWKVTLSFGGKSLSPDLDLK